MGSSFAEKDSVGITVVVPVDCRPKTATTIKRIREMYFMKEVECMAYL
jgi:hypothetical protein